jgi:hypothetical protein
MISIHTFAFADVPPYLFLLAVLPLILAAIPLLLNPIRNKNSQKFAAYLNLKTFDPIENPPPQDVNRHLQSCIEQLDRLGFELVTHLVVVKPLSDVNCITALLENRHFRDVAAVTIVFTSTQSVGGRVTVQDRYVSFGSKLPDETTVTTSNSDQLYAFRASHQRRFLQFEKVADLGCLFRLHQRSVRHFGGNVKRPYSSKREELIEEFADGIVEELFDQLETGFLFLQSDGQYYRLTWKGAILMTWGVSWPFVQIRLARRRKRARQLLQEWDVQNVVG